MWELLEICKYTTLILKRLIIAQKQIHFMKEDDTVLGEITVYTIIHIQGFISDDSSIIE